MCRKGGKDKMRGEEDTLTFSMRVHESSMRVKQTRRLSGRQGDRRGRKCEGEQVRKDGDCNNRGEKEKDVDERDGRK